MCFMLCSSGSRLPCAFFNICVTPFLFPETMHYSSIISMLIRSMLMSMHSVWVMTCYFTYAGKILYYFAAVCVHHLSCIVMFSTVCAPLLSDNYVLRWGCAFLSSATTQELCSASDSQSGSGSATNPGTEPEIKTLRFRAQLYLSPAQEVGKTERKAQSTVPQASFTDKTFIYKTKP